MGLYPGLWNPDQWEIELMDDNETFRWIERGDRFATFMKVSEYFNKNVRLYEKAFRMTKLFILTSNRNIFKLIL